MPFTAYNLVLDAGGTVGLTQLGLAKVLGVSRITVSRWTRTGIVPPMYRGAGKRGPTAVSLYGPLEVAAFEIVQQLRRRGVSAERLRKLAGMLKAAGGFSAVAAGELGIVVPESRREPVRVVEIQEGRVRDERGQLWFPALYFDPSDTALTIRTRIRKLPRGAEVLNHAA